MADNTTLNPGAGGDTYASDDISGVKHQRVKIEIGADGAAADVHSGNPMPTSEVKGTAAARSTSTTTSDAQILASNTSRKRVVFHNNGDKDFLLGEGTTTVTTSSFTMRLPPGATFASDDYTGAYRGLYVSAVGAGELQITEVT